MKIIDMPEFKNRNSILSCGPNKKIQTAVKEMSQKQCGSILIVQHGKILGIFTERDLLTRVVPNDVDVKKTPIKDVMTTSPETTTADEPVTNCLARMSKGHYRHMPILDEDKKVIGLPRLELLQVLDSIGYKNLEFEDWSSEESPDHQLISEVDQFINFWLDDGILTEIQWGPPIEEED